MVIGMIVEKTQAKTLVRKSKIDDWWWSEASLNPYQGCFHNCVYCDGKAESYFIHEDFGTRIKAKVNAPSLLEKFLDKEGFIATNRKKAPTLMEYFPNYKLNISQPSKYIFAVGGGVTDVYQPAEREVKLTRRLLSIFLDYNIPVQLLTKNVNVLRDLDLLIQIKELSYANVGFSITLVDEKTQKIFEPRASSTEARFEALRKIREAGIHGGVIFMPILPLIGDTIDNMREMFYWAKEVGAEYVLPAGLTLKPGRNKKEFMKVIESTFPENLEVYSQLYGNNDKYGTLDSKKFEELELTSPYLLGFDLSKKTGIPCRMPRYIPDGRIRPNIQVSTLLFRIAVMKSILSSFKEKVYPIKKSAYLIEQFKSNIQDLSVEELSSFSSDKKTRLIIQDLVQTGSSNYLNSINQDKNVFYN